MAEVYREHLKSDSALVTVLSILCRLLPTICLACANSCACTNRSAVARSARNAGPPGGARDGSPGASRAVALYRSSMARSVFQRPELARCLREASSDRPERREAVDKLKELYTKRRAYKPLYDLLESQAVSLPAGEERRDLWIEMAKLAAERLDSGALAIGLYKRVLDETPASSAALDAMRSKPNVTRTSPP